MITKHASLFILLYFLFSSSVVADEHCGNNKQARLLAQLIIQDKQQKRTNLRCNKLLTDIAVAKASKMLEFGLVAHNLGGSPNDRLREAGYQLPNYYGSEFNSNQVEAIAGGYESAEEVWRGFKSSTPHRTHLLAEHEFYQEQDEIGVALIKEWHSPHVEYWVVYLTKGLQENQTSEPLFNDIPNKGLFIIQTKKASD